MLVFSSFVHCTSHHYITALRSNPPHFTPLFHCTPLHSDKSLHYITSITSLQTTPLYHFTSNHSTISLHYNTALHTLPFHTSPIYHCSPLDHTTAHRFISPPSYFNLCYIISLISFLISPYYTSFFHCTALQVTPLHTLHCITALHTIYFLCIHESL